MAEKASFTGRRALLFVAAQPEQRHRAGDVYKRQPLGNIKLADGKPVWGDRCTHCMACISRCPKEAIEYGTHSRGLPRYLCPKQA